MGESMTPRQRWLAALRLEPVDRLPFWPKLNGSYAPYQSGSWRIKTTEELHRWVGSDLHSGVPRCVRAVRSRTSIETVENDGVRRHIHKTPAGNLEGESHWNEGSQSWHPCVFPV